MATPFPTVTFHFFVSDLGQVLGTLKPSALASRFAPRHCGQSCAERPVPLKTAAPQTQTPIHFDVPFMVAPFFASSIGIGLPLDGLPPEAGTRWSPYALPNARLTKRCQLFQRRQRRRPLGSACGAANFSAARLESIHEDREFNRSPLGVTNQPWKRVRCEYSSWIASSADPCVSRAADQRPVGQHAISENTNFVWKCGTRSVLIIDNFAASRPGYCESIRIFRYRRDLAGLPVCAAFFVHCRPMVAFELEGGRSMSSAEISLILDCGLAEDEKNKFYRLEHRIAGLFATFGEGIRLCEGIGAGNLRKILLGTPGQQEQPPVSLPAGWFLTASDDEVLNELEDRLWCRGECR